MSLRSKVVIESNLKPSQFGKPATPENNNEDFEETYESPLEKIKPLPPGLEQVQELPRNEPETMEFSNPSKNVVRHSNVSDSSSARDLTPAAVQDNAGSDAREDSVIVTLDNPSDRRSHNTNLNSKDNASGFTNEGFDAQSLGHQLIPGLSVNGNEKLVTIESQDTASGNRKMSSSSKGKNEDGLREDKPDISFRTVANVIKSLDVNRYATKKTIAQGMLDIALLTANASQLKYILQIGKQHEFYILMLSLICISIGLQVIHGVICIVLGSSLNINKPQDQKKACVWNNLCLVLMMLTVVVNAVISAFDMRDNAALTQSNATRGAPSIQLPSGGR